MNWKPTTSHTVRQQRAQMLYDIRTFFLQRNVLEVETPALSQSGNSDPFIESFQLKNNKTSKYLHTSPEYPMKRLLAAGSGDIYQICKVWRKGESGRNHNPEFTLLEWYRVGFSYQQLMQEVSDLLHELLPKLTKKNKFFSYENLFLEKFGINPHIASHDELIHCVNENISSLCYEGLNKQDILDALLTHCIEPDFSTTCLTFIYDYPVSQSALAQIRQEDHYPVAERFEVYRGPMELGNGYQEEVGFERNKQILESENNARKKTGKEIISQDHFFLAACESGIPRTSGVAIGLDRILMCISGEESIQKVINFPWDVA